LGKINKHISNIQSLYFYFPGQIGQYVPRANFNKITFALVHEIFDDLQPFDRTIYLIGHILNHVGLTRGINGGGII